MGGCRCCKKKPPASAPSSPKAEEEKKAPKEAPKIPGDDLLVLKQNTDMTDEELHLWYGKFMEAFPEGYANVSDYDTTIDFHEFMEGISVANSDIAGKLRWTFKMLDRNKDGFLTKDELLQVYEASDALGEKKRDWSTQEMVDNAFTRLGCKKSCSMTTFVDTCIADEVLMKQIHTLMDFQNDVYKLGGKDPPQEPVQLQV